MLSRLEGKPRGFNFRHQSRICGSEDVIGLLWAEVGGRENQQREPRVFMPAPPVSRKWREAQLGLRYSLFVPLRIAGIESRQDVAQQRNNIFDEEGKCISP